MPITNTSVGSGFGFTVTVPKQQTFKISEGKYAASIKSARPLAKQNSRGSVPYARFLFSVTVPGLENYECLAKADFRLDLNSGSELRNVVDRLLGKNHLSSLSGQQFDLESLVDKAVEIEVEHVNLDGRENHDFPLVVVRDIQLPGTMSLTRPRCVLA